MKIETEYIAGYIIATLNTSLFSTKFSKDDNITKVRIPYPAYWYMDPETINSDSYNRTTIFDAYTKAAFEKYVAENKFKVDEAVKRHFKETLEKDYQILNTEFILDTLNEENKSWIMPYYEVTIMNEKL